ncbi:hypothetical protein [Streptomyces sp. NPDC059874]|uniref:hypothetical protein n=1 Tax=Streptomyces sp. NPDC059874 TaxID=3346983 RepID=UPI0036518C3E
MKKPQSSTTISLRTSASISDDEIRKAAETISTLAVLLLPDVEVNVTTSLAVSDPKGAKGGWSYDF